MKSQKFRKSEAEGASDFSPALPSTLGDHVYAELRGAIIAGRFEPGEKLTIRGLASALNTSPTPIREALRRLAAEGALEIAPNRYIGIPVMTPEQLCELRDVRTVLEGMATERAATRITEADLEVLCAHDKAIRRLRDTGDIKAIIREIQQFHFTIYRASGMAALVLMIESLWVRTAPYVNLLFPGYSKIERGNLRGLTLAALERHDSASARRWIEADIGGALDYIIQLAEEKRASEGTGGGEGA